MSYTHWARVVKTLSPGPQQKPEGPLAMFGQDRGHLPTLAYGTTKLGTHGTHKTNDKIDLTTECKYKVGLYINPLIALGIKTQIAQGYGDDAQGKTTLIPFLKIHLEQFSPYVHPVRACYTRRCDVVRQGHP